MNLGVCDADGKNIRKVTWFTNGEQVYTPGWSPDGKQITFGFESDDKQTVAVINQDGTGFKIIVQGVDSRNPVFAPNGGSLIYAADEGGIFNIYSIDLATNAKKQLTSVLGGAFLPAVGPDGVLAFASYTSSGYKIAYLKEPKPLEIASKLSMPAWVLKKYDRVDGLVESVPTNADGLAGVSGGIDTSDYAAVAAPKPYKNTFSSLSIIPILRVDNYNPRNKGIDVIRPGLYFTSSDVLDRFSFFGGAVMNRQLERDIFGIVEYRDAIPFFYQLGLAPTLSIELYNISRKTDATIPIFTDRLYNLQTDVTYNLFEFDLSVRQNILEDGTQLKLGYSLSRYNADIGSFVVPDVGLSPGFLNLYLIGNVLSAQITHNGILPSVDRDINPVGRTISLRYYYEFDKFNPEGQYLYENGLLVPQVHKTEFS